MKNDIFDELVASVREGAAILQGQASPSHTFVIEAPDIKRIRAGYKLSQSQFAALLGISTATLRNWEQGRRHPEGPARVLLQIAAKHPEVLLDNISQSKASLSKKAVSKEKKAAKSSAKG